MGAPASLRPWQLSQCHTAPSTSHSEPSTIIAHQAASNPSRTHHSPPHRGQGPGEALKNLQNLILRAPLPATPWHPPPFAWDSRVGAVHAALHLNGPSLTHSPTVGFKNQMSPPLPLAKPSLTLQALPSLPCVHSSSLAPLLFYSLQYPTNVTLYTFPRWFQMALKKT